MWQIHRSLSRSCIAAAVLAVAGLGSAAVAQPLTTAFTYQGVLRQSNAPLNGTADLRFRLFDAALAGAQIGPTLSLNNVSVSNGLVTANLDFGVNAFAGNQRWLQIDITSPANGGAGPFTPLSPRQSLTAVPYAVYALTGNTQWTTNGSAINYTTGNVSVGTASQFGRLTIFPAAGGGGTQTGLFVRNTDTSNQYSVSQFIADSTHSIGVLASVAPGVGAGRAISAVNSSPNGWAGYFDGRGYFSDTLLVGRTNTIGAEVFGIGAATSGFAGMYASTNADGEPFYGYSAGGDIDAYHYYNSADDSWRLLVGAIRMTVLGSNGNVGIGTVAPEARMHLVGGSDTSPTGGGYLVLGPTSSTNISIDSNEIMARSNGVVSTLHLNADGGDVSVSQSGTGRLICRVLQITGGADLSEQFEVNADQVEPEPGMVVVIDPRNPGQLVPATQAYDKKVAGVISGAGGVATGMMMGHTGTIADGAHAVALTGRVYCQVDASECAIEPGDLLTTSNTPGHAMKATDESRSHGTIIGKAMTALPRGEKGLVLVLVNLQ